MQLWCLAPERSLHHPHSSHCSPPEHGTPTSVAFCSTEPAHVVAAFRTGDTVLYDAEASRPVLTLESRTGSGEHG